MIRKSPNLSATIFPIKTRRLGNDENIWEVKKFKNSKRWVLSEDQTPIKIKKMKSELFGQYKNKKQKYKDFDIIKSKILNNVFLINKLSTEYNPDTNKMYLHHSYESITKDYIGSWYTLHFLEGRYKLDGVKKKLIYYIPLYENDWIKEIKNVKVEIYFSEKGWLKFTKIFY
jgi:hypothetical protein